ncbi:hypothetical protein Q3G72_004125 [Acer saccharum]|nr:hypothetical protein Q3G72_004125 [Acer saccharum]
MLEKLNKIFEEHGHKNHGRIQAENAAGQGAQELVAEQGNAQEQPPNIQNPVTDFVAVFEEVAISQVKFVSRMVEYFLVGEAEELQALQQGALQSLDNVQQGALRSLA